MPYTVTLLPGGERVAVEPGRSVLEAAREQGFALEAPCGGRGVCGGCAVEVLEGPAELPVSAEDRRHLSPARLARGFRLACRLIPGSDLTVRVPPPGEVAPAKLEVLAAESLETRPDRAIRKVLVRPAVGTLENIRIPLEEALREALPPGTPPPVPLEAVAGSPPWPAGESRC